MQTTNVKVAYSAKGITPQKIDPRLCETHKPRLGDMAVFEVLSLGKHTKIQADDKTNCHILPGDYIMATFGPRYATNQFEGYIPEGPMEEYHILGQGGAIGILASNHAKFDKIGPTCLRMLGYAVDALGQVMNTRYYRNPKPEGSDFSSQHGSKVQTILSIGSSMDSGKTTSAAYLARGLRAAGNTVAYIKLTGTIYSKDADLARNLGANMAIDFSYFGYPSTYMVDLPELLELHKSLLQTVMRINPDYILIEVADGLLQRETAALLSSAGFMDTIDHVLLSCGDSLGVVGGLNILAQHKIHPFALAGLFTVSPLLIKEVIATTSTPVLGLEELMDLRVCELLKPRVLPKSHMLQLEEKLSA